MPKTAKWILGILGALVVLSVIIVLGNSTSKRFQPSSNDSSKKVALITQLERLVPLDPNGYREAKWGMTVKEVRAALKKRENSKASDLSDASFFFGKGSYTAFDVVAEHLSVVLYIFVQDRLTGVTIFFDQDLMRVSNSTISDFEDIEEHLKSKYGEPFTEKRTAGEFSNTWSFFSSTPITDAKIANLDKEVNTFMVLKLGKSGYRAIEGTTLSLIYVSTKYGETIPQTENPF